METPKNLTTQPMVDPGGPTDTSHAASRVPPMDYRDNRQRWAESHQVVHFYAGQWCTFTPALTEYGEPVFHARLGQVPDHEGE